MSKGAKQRVAADARRKAERADEHYSYDATFFTDFIEGIRAKSQDWKLPPERQ
jgi:hypothetical protein